MPIILYVVFEDAGCRVHWYNIYYITYICTYDIRRWYVCIIRKCLFFPRNSNTKCDLSTYYGRVCPNFRTTFQSFLWIGSQVTAISNLYTIASFICCKMQKCAFVSTTESMETGKSRVRVSSINHRKGTFQMVLNKK